MSVIAVVAALLTGPDGRALMVRKRGTERFMQPGGKLEEGEEPLDGLRRELREELGLDLPRERFEELGAFTADAANEPGHELLALVWRARLADEGFGVAAEIDEARWIDPHDPGDVPLAPLSEHVLLPLLSAD